MTILRNFYVSKLGYLTVSDGSTIVSDFQEFGVPTYCCYSVRVSSKKTFNHLPGVIINIIDTNSNDYSYIAIAEPFNSVRTNYRY